MNRKFRENRADRILLSLTLRKSKIKSKLVLAHPASIAHSFCSLKKNPISWPAVAISARKKGVFLLGEETASRRNPISLTQQIGIELRIVIGFAESNFIIDLSSRNSIAVTTTSINSRNEQEQWRPVL